MLRARRPAVGECHLAAQLFDRADCVKMRRLRRRAQIERCLAAHELFPLRADEAQVVARPLNACRRIGMVEDGGAACCTAAQAQADLQDGSPSYHGMVGRPLISS